MYEYPSVISYVRESIHKEKEMSNIKSIFSRATIRGVADYLLFGNGPDEDSRDCEERMEEIYMRFEKTVAKYDPRVIGSKIILNGTTIDEVKKYHRDTLVLCVSEANRREEKILQDKKDKEAREQLREQEYYVYVSSMADEITFK